MEFIPALPPAHDQLYQKLASGYVISVVITYRSRWWWESGLSGMALSDQGPVSAIYDQSTPTQPALYALICGQRARELGYDSDPTDRRRIVLRHIANVLGEEALSPISYKEKDWMADPWFRGGPCGVPTTGFYQAFTDIIRLPQGKIFFASSELSESRPGTMDGAVEAGERAANEAVQQLRMEKSYLPSANTMVNSSSGGTGASTSAPITPPAGTPSSAVPPTSAPVGAVPLPSMAGTPARAPPPLPNRGPTGGLASSMST
jgi:hypothetical protein